MNTKEPMTEWLRVRAGKNQRRKLETVAELQGLKLSDVVRVACNQYVLRFSTQTIPPDEKYRG